MSQLSKATRAALQLLEKELCPVGWQITTSVSPPNVHIELDHELSSPRGINFPVGHQRPESVIAAVLASPEFSVVARHPQDLQHGKLLRRLREVAASNGWDSQILVGHRSRARSP